MLIALQAGSLSAQNADRPDRAEHHTFTLERFTFESGPTVPNVQVVYDTYGHLNAARDNAILLPSHYMATHHGYEWLIGPGLALDTTRYFLVATELFGNGHSSSPSNTPEPFHDPGQRRGSPPPADPRPRDFPPEGDHRLLDGRRASISVGGELPGLQ